MSLKITFTNDDTGASYTDSCHRINAVMIDKLRKEARIYVAIYCNETQKDAGKGPLSINGNSTMGFLMPSSEYDTYLAVSVLNTANNNIFKKCYDYLKTLEVSKVGPVFSMFDYKNDSTDV